jgi:hypothetical protein
LERRKAVNHAHASGESMIIMAWTSSIFVPGDKRRPSSARPSSARPAGYGSARARITHLLFYRPAGMWGTIGRIGLLAIGAVLSYFVGSGLGELMMKAPVPMALLFGAVLFAMASRDPG